MTTGLTMRWVVAAEVSAEGNGHGRSPGSTWRLIWMGHCCDLYVPSLTLQDLVAKSVTGGVHCRLQIACLEAFAGSLLVLLDQGH